MRGEIHDAIDTERDRQDAKWGADRTLPFGDWSMILGEEVGEVNEAMLDATYGKPDKRIAHLEHLEVELIQVAAVAVAIVEQIRRQLDLMKIPAPKGCNRHADCSQKKQGSSCCHDDGCEECFGN